MPIILIVGDGMADRPLKEFNQLTPLEIAEPRNMDKLALSGVTGLLDPIAPGVAPGSDAANLTLMGYNYSEVGGGRGGFEAIGAGLNLKEGDLAFRCDFATVNKDFNIVDERAGRIRESVKDLSCALKDLQLKNTSDVEVVFNQTLGFKGVLVLRGEKLSNKVSTSIPKISQKAYPLKPTDDSAEAKRTAKVLNEFIKRSHEILDRHPINQSRRNGGDSPANALIPWGGGTLPRLQSFYDRYQLRATCVAAAPIVKGICRLSGMKVVDVLGATGEVETDTAAKARAALESSQGSDLVYVHVGGPDEASHDGDIPGKIAIIKRIDSMVGMIMERVDFGETCVVLLSDHTTSTELRDHTGDPTPIAMAFSDVNQDEVEQYSERAVQKGGLGRMFGKHIMSFLINLTRK